MIVSAGSRGRCWNPILKGDGFNTSRGGGQKMLMYQKKTCLIAIIAKENIFSLENLE